MVDRGPLDMTVSASDLRYICGVVRDDTANALSDRKEYLVETRLAALARREGLESVSDLVTRLRAGAPALRKEVIEAMMTNETYFFRDVHPFEALRNEIIPAILRARPDRPLSVWSAATSTGQEAFSLALLLREGFGDVEARILATDVSSKALGRARAGRFSQLEVNRGLPVTLLVKHFDRHGREWWLHDDIRNMVAFRQVNLISPLKGIEQMDVILLRNLLIYFDEPGRTAVLNQMARILRPGGYLFLGAAETYGLPSTFERSQVGRSTCFRRTVGPIPDPSGRRVL